MLPDEPPWSWVSIFRYLADIGYRHFLCINSPTVTTFYWIIFILGLKSASQKCGVHAESSSFFFKFWVKTHVACFPSDLSPHRDIQTVILDCFSSINEEVKSAASFALGIPLAVFSLIPFICFSIEKFAFLWHLQWQGFVMRNSFHFFPPSKILITDALKKDFQPFWKLMEAHLALHWMDVSIMWPAETEVKVTLLCLCVATHKIVRCQYWDPSAQWASYWRGHWETIEQINKVQL